MILLAAILDRRCAMRMRARSLVRTARGRKFATSTKSPVVLKKVKKPAIKFTKATNYPSQSVCRTKKKCDNKFRTHSFIEILSVCRGSRQQCRFWQVPQAEYQVSFPGLRLLFIFYFVASVQISRNRFRQVGTCLDSVRATFEVKLSAPKK